MHGLGCCDTQQYRAEQVSKASKQVQIAVINWTSFYLSTDTSREVHMPFAMFTFRVKKASVDCSPAWAALALVILCHGVASRSLLQTFIPQGLDSCTGYVKGSCTLSTEAAPWSDACSQKNAQQLAADVTGQDASQVTVLFTAKRTVPAGLITAVKLEFYPRSITAGCDACLLWRLHHQALEGSERAWNVTDLQELLWQLLSGCAGCGRYTMS